MSAFFQIRLIILLVAASCSIVGTFLILRQMSMMVDSITHTILLGIVIAFFIVEDLNSPLLIIGAALTGLFTVWLTESLHGTGLVSKDSAIGIVFPLLFSIAIILISKFASNVHLDVDSVLLGKVEYAPFDFLFINGKNYGAKSIYVMGFILLLNILVVSLFFKEFKLTTFDSGLALTLGFSVVAINYLLMGLVSITTVGAFQAVGSILVISFIVGPPATAYLITKDLKKMMLLSIIIGVVDSFIGIEIAFKYNLSIAGTVAMVIGSVFMLLFLFNPQDGLLGESFRRARQRREFKKINIMFHIMNHSLEGDNKIECNLYTMNNHLKLKPREYNNILDSLKRDRYIHYDENDTVLLTVRGLNYIKNQSEKIFNK